MKSFLRVLSLGALLPVLFLSCKNNNGKSDHALTVHIKYDTPVNGYMVTGEFYPFDAQSETGQVELHFKAPSGGQSFIYSNVGKTENGNPETPAKFTGLNLCEYISTDENTLFHDGDTLVFHYNTEAGILENSSLYYYAEFQFFDVDFDGEDEFLVNDYYRGKGGNNYEVYEITPEGLNKKSFEPFDRITSSTDFDAKRRVITDVLRDGVFNTDYTEYEIAPDGNSARVIGHREERNNY